MSNKSEQKINWMPYWLIAPAILLIVIFMIYPMGNVFYYSFQNYNINSPFYNGYAGFSNFYDIFTKSTIFYTSLWVSVKWVFVEVFLQAVFGLILALVLNQAFRFRSLFRTVSFLPWAISGITTSTLWSLMFNQQIGVVNDLLMKIGLIHSPIAWTANLHTAFWAVVISELWRGIPFFAITLLAALQTIPSELYESANVDGAGRWVSFVNITFPFLKETIILTTLLRSVWEFNNVDLIYNMTGGGPVNKTMTLAMYVANQAVKLGNFGYGSALTVVVFIILLFSAMLYLRISGYGKGEK